MKSLYKSKFLLLFVILFITNSVIKSQGDFIIDIEVINSTSDVPNTEFIEALFTISFLPGEENTFLSIGAEDQSTFLFDIIINNLLLPSSSIVGNERHEISQRFNIAPLMANNQHPELLRCYVHILKEIGFYPYDPDTWKDTKDVTVSEINENAEGHNANDQKTDVGRGTVSPPGHTIGDQSKLYRNRTKESFNLDLDNSANGITNDFAGDLNACVPTATANSMQWMNLKYNDISLPANLNLRETMKELSKFMNREDGEGVDDMNMIRGKLDFFEHYELPVEVKFQSTEVNGNISSTSGNSIARNFNLIKNNKSKPPTWDFITKMMREGEDVEINYTWYNNAGEYEGGHCANLTGFVEYESGVKKIQLEHDFDQEQSGGTKREVIEIAVTDSGWMRFSRGREARWIESVIAESPIIEEGRETAAWLNELFVTSNGSNNVVLEKVNAGAEVNLEVALRAAVTDIDNYQVQIYNGETGLSDTAVSLNEFTMGNESNGLLFYTHTLNIPENSNNHFGICITYSGSIIGKQFLSFGGEFLGIDGDATQMMSNDIGIITQGTGLALSGFGETYAAYSWKATTEFTNGAINSGQSFTDSLPEVPLPIEPANGINEAPTNISFVWSSAQLANSYTLEISTDIEFANVIYMKTEITDTAQMVENLTSSQMYYWRILAENGNGKSDYSDTWSFTTIVTDIENREEIPNEFNLYQNYPNPFNPTTTINYAIPMLNNANGISVKINVFDILGRYLKTLVNKPVNPGNHSVQFDAAEIPSGVYYYQIKAGSFVQTRKMILLK